MQDPLSVSYSTRRVTLPDGVAIAVTESGRGRPLLMFHGWLSDSQGNWIGPGFADAFVAAGHRVLMVDHRGHGRSDRPPATPQAFPTDVLARDGLELVQALGLRDYDLLGYSIGARTALRMVIRGAKPRRVVLAGLGADTLYQDPAEIDAFEAGMLGPPPAADDVSIPALLRKLADATGVDKPGALAILRSAVETPRAAYAAFTMPTLIILGRDDLGIGPPEPLRDAIADSTLRRVDGDHMTALGKPEMKAEIVRFLADK